MKKIKMIVVLITVLTIAGSVQTAEAQGRGHERHGAEVRVSHPVVVRQAHARYSNLPRWGTTVTTRPAASIEIRSHRNPYYSTNGIYYAPRNSGYAVVRPSRGLRISVLPLGYRAINVGRRNYFYYYGTYYSGSGNQYTVVDPPIGAVVDALPDGYEVQMIRGNEYYVLDGVYYAEVDAPEFPDGVGYQVVNP